jgi:K+-transporting ATPase ATPase C chain
LARVRGVPPATVQRQVAAYTEWPLFGFLGEPRMNLLALNLALDGVGR